MDEVLLYVFAPDEHEAYISQPMQDFDFCVYYPDFDIYLNIYKRPYLKEFLEYLRENTEPILYTKGVKSYVDLVLKLVDPENTFKHVVT
jgi:TFIIF-interacting CTD phosphatase-like protein